MDADRFRKYGFGWLALQYLPMQADTAWLAGALIYARLKNRGLQSGSKVQVYATNIEEGPPYSPGPTSFQYSAGPMVFQRAWPRESSG